MPTARSNAQDHGEAVTAVTTEGYQFIFVLRGVRYEYRASLADANSLRFCENPTGAIFELPTLVPVTPNTDPPTVLDAALALLNTRLGYTLNYADFDNPRSSWSWQLARIPELPARMSGRRR